MKRDNVLDIVKGLAIFLVIFGHVISSNACFLEININNLIYIFHMPLFFIISGILISHKKDTTFLKFIKQKAKSIMIPYFVFSILSFLYWYLIERKFRGNITMSPSDIFFNIFIMKTSGDLLIPNIVLWFLPCMFVANIIFYFIRKLDKKYIRIIISIILFLIGYIFSIKNIVLPFSFDTALIAILFLDFGYEISDIILNKKIEKISLTQTFVGIILLIGIYVICFIYNGNISMLGHQYGSPLMFFLGAICGSSLIYFISYYISKLSFTNKIISFLGKNSLVIMLTHEPIKRIIIFIISKLFHIEEIVLRNNIMPSIIITIIIICVILPIIHIINNFLPLIIGKNKKATPSLRVL